MSTMELLDRPRTDRTATRHTLRQALAAAWRQWRERRKACRELAVLDERILRDIGIPRELIVFELRQPWWRPLRDWRDLRGGSGRGPSYRRPASPFDHDL